MSDDSDGFEGLFGGENAPESVKEQARRIKEFSETVTRKVRATLLEILSIWTVGEGDKISEPTTNAIFLAGQLRVEIVNCFLNAFILGNEELGQEWLDNHERIQRAVQTLDLRGKTNVPGAREDLLRTLELIRQGVVTVITGNNEELPGDN